VNAQRDFAAVGDKDFLNGHFYAIANNGWSYSTG